MAKSPATLILSDFQGAWKTPTLEIHDTRVIFFRFIPPRALLV
jgi:hypothetical protein